MFKRTVAKHCDTRAKKEKPMANVVPFPNSPVFTGEPDIGVEPIGALFTAEDIADLQPTPPVTHYEPVPEPQPVFVVVAPPQAQPSTAMGLIVALVCGLASFGLVSLLLG